jgi:Gas vesicle protein
VTAVSATGREDLEWEQVALVDLLDRVLATGVVVVGDVTLSIAGLDLVHLSLQAVLASVRPGGPGPVPEGPP